MFFHGRRGRRETSLGGSLPFRVTVTAKKRRRLAPALLEEPEEVLEEDKDEDDLYDASPALHEDEGETEYNSNDDNDDNDERYLLLADDFEVSSRAPTVASPLALERIHERRRHAPSRRVRSSTSSLLAHQTPRTRYDMLMSATESKIALPPNTARDVTGKPQRQPGRRRRRGLATNGGAEKSVPVLPKISRLVKKENRDGAMRLHLALHGRDRHLHVTSAPTLQYVEQKRAMSRNMERIHSILKEHERERRRARKEMKLMKAGASHSNGNATKKRTAADPEATTPTAAAAVAKTPEVILRKTIEVNVRAKLDEYRFDTNKREKLDHKIAERARRLRGPLEKVKRNKDSSQFRPAKVLEHRQEVAERERERLENVMRRKAELEERRRQQAFLAQARIIGQEAMRRHANEEEMRLLEEDQAREGGVIQWLVVYTAFRASHALAAIADRICGRRRAKEAHLAFLERTYRKRRVCCRAVLAFCRFRAPLLRRYYAEKASFVYRFFTLARFVKKIRLGIHATSFRGRVVSLQRWWRYQYACHVAYFNVLDVQWRTHERRLLRVHHMRHMKMMEEYEESVDEKPPARCRKDRRQRPGHQALVAHQHTRGGSMGLLASISRRLPTAERHRRVWALVHERRRQWQEAMRAWFVDCADYHRKNDLLIEMITAKQELGTTLTPEEETILVPPQQPRFRPLLRFDEMEQHVLDANHELIRGLLDEALDEAGGVGGEQ